MSDSLKDDKEFIIDLIDQCSGYIFKHVSEKLRDDRDVVISAITQSGVDYVYDRMGMICRYSCVWDHRKEFLLEKELKEYQYTVIEYASQRLRSDKEIVLAAVKVDASAIEYCSEDLKMDKDIIDAVNRSKKNRDYELR